MSDQPQSFKPKMIPGGEAHVLAELVSVQKGAIVSRTLCKTKGGSVTAFAFDAGQALSEHTAPFDALVQVTSGAAEISLDGQWSTVSEGQLFLMPAGIPHAVRADVAFTMLLTMLREDR